MQDVKETVAFKKCLINGDKKSCVIAVLLAKTIISRERIKPNYELHHIIASVAAHGFHDKIC
jgi:hypothetical protein